MRFPEDCTEHGTLLRPSTDRVQGLEKHIPDAPSNQTPVHLRDYQIFANTNKYVLKSGEADVGIPKDKASA